MNFKIGTRGSRLALKQCEIVSGLLKEKFPDLELETKIIKTKGDKITSAPFAEIGGKGLFVKEIDEAVIRGEVDFAVHSMKDVPTDLMDDIKIACIPKREEINDALVSCNGLKIDELPKKAVIGTCSIRRKAELLNYRGDLVIRDIRGNVDTRIRKVVSGEYDAAIMAKAGLKRLNLEGYITQTLPTANFAPSIGQGAIVVVAAGDFEYMDMLDSINDKKSKLGVNAERALLKGLGGGCQVPIGAVTKIIEKKLILRGVVLSQDGKKRIEVEERGNIEKAVEIGELVARKLLENGAGIILEEVYGK